VPAKDGSLYVCDRDGDRVQVFKKDGTFVKEKFVAVKAMGAGAAFDVDFSPDHRYLYWVDGRNQVVRILQADSLEEIGSFGSAGSEAGQFRNVHSIAAILKTTFTSVKQARVSAFRSSCPNPANNG
jgi:6-phosphogluconolactonase (cycloisomerase 2 family)